MKNSNLTYEKSGVNIKAADNFVKFLSSLSKKRQNSKNFQNIGGFGSITNIPKNIKNPQLVASTDGVGTKIEIANELNKFDTIGIDLVAMCVNDLIVQGAKPLIFLDYISINKIKSNKLKQIIKGIIKGCKISNCELVGGETAEMPGTYSKGKFDIAGFSVGVVNKKKILDKSKIKVNDLIIGIPSSGIHSNGYSLIRYILKKNKIKLKSNKFLKRELIKPTKIYVKEVLNLLDKKLINGCANITGGGLRDNIARILPKKFCAKIDLSKIKPNKIFRWIHSKGVSDSEMIKTFNCGIGFCIIIKPNKYKKIKKYFSKNFRPYVIGTIMNEKKNIELNGKIKW